MEKIILKKLLNNLTNGLENIRKILHHFRILLI